MATVNQDAGADAGGAAAEGGVVPVPGPLAGGAGGPADPAAHANPGAGPPDMAALLQQVVTATQAVAASSQAIAARVTALEQAEGQHQPLGPPHVAMGAHPAGPPSPRPSRCHGAQPQAAATTAAINANARLAADVWRSMAGTKYFLARGNFSVAEELTPDIQRFILKKVAGFTTATTRQLQSLAELAVEDFFPPAPAGETPATMPAEVHLRTFSAAFVAVLEYGMASAPDICKYRVENQKKELNAVLERLQSYLQHPFLALAPYPAQVRAMLLTAINVGLDDHMHDLAGQAGTLWREHSNAPPPPGSGPPPAVPEFTRLKPLLVGGSSDSLAERPRQWKTSPVKAAGAGAGKRKPAAGAEGSKATVGRGRSDLGEGARAFKARMLEWETLPGVCEYTWRSDTCPRTACRYDHDRVAPPSRLAASAQQQPTPPPSPPTQPSQRPEQAATTGGGGAPSGGGSRPPPVARYSRTQGADGRAAPPPGPGPGRSSGASTN
eukprot:jgi/Undpi1/615/HiC_scaffold_10.g04079.m1